MNTRSLAFRLALLSFFSISIALVAASYALSARFTQYFETRIYAELEQHLEQLTTNISLNSEGNVRVEELLDRRFAQPFSGLYWQVDEAGELPVYSRSLWGRPFDIPENPVPGQQFRTVSKSPTGQAILVLGWPVLIGEEGVQRTIILAVAIDESELEDAASGFRLYLVKLLLGMFVGLMVAAWVQVQIGLAPLKVIKSKVERVITGVDKHLEGQFPSEVKPLVVEVNDLLDMQEKSLATARARASDLAHGLKTPLTVMRSLALELETDGEFDKAAEFEAQINSMHRFIERELARSKTAIKPNSKTPVLPVAERMIASMKKLPLGGGLDWGVSVDPGVVIPLDEHDLSELFGNILDNARKWAKSSVLVSSDPGGFGVSIEDDGPGIPEHLLETVFARGKSLDTSNAGAGLGLPISNDLLDSIGGGIRLTRSGLGGLKVEISWG